MGTDQLSSEVTVQLTCAFVICICENQVFSLRGSGIERTYTLLDDGLLYRSCRERVRRRSVYMFVQSDGSFCC